MSEYVACESLAAIVHHIRKIGDRKVAHGGHRTPRPFALCGREVAWDTSIPVDAATCRDCLAKYQEITK